jgi:hypothetical protein
MDDAFTIVTTTQPGDSFKKLEDWVDGRFGLKERYSNLADYLYNTQEMAETF